MGKRTIYVSEKYNKIAFLSLISDDLMELFFCRHNIRAPLAAMIDSYSKEAQVIKILDYYIHPKHAVDPRDDNHDLHNVAILKLACKYEFRIWMFSIILEQCLVKVILK